MEDNSERRGTEHGGRRGEEGERVSEHWRASERGWKGNERAWEGAGTGNVRGHGGTGRAGMRAWGQRGGRGGERMAEKGGGKGKSPGQLGRVAIVLCTWCPRRHSNIHIAELAMCSVLLQCATYRAAKSHSVFLFVSESVGGRTGGECVCWGGGGRGCGGLPVGTSGLLHLVVLCGGCV